MRDRPRSDSVCHRRRSEAGFSQRNRSPLKTGSCSQMHPECHKTRRNDTRKKGNEKKHEKHREEAERRRKKRMKDRGQDGMNEGTQIKLITIKVKAI